MTWFFSPQVQMFFGIVLTILGTLIAGDAPRLDSIGPGLVLGIAGAVCLRTAWEGYQHERDQNK